MGNTSAAGMPGTADPLDELAVGVAADHKAGKHKPKAEPVAEDDGGDGITTQAMEDAAIDADIAAETLVGDVRDALIEIVKHRPKPWDQMLAGEQRDVAHALEFAAKEIVRKAVIAIAAAGRPSIQAVFKGYADKGGELSGTVKFLTVTDDDVLALHRASGQQILMVVADATRFTGQRREADVDQDEPILDFDAGADDVD